MKLGSIRAAVVQEILFFNNVRGRVFYFVRIHLSLVKIRNCQQQKIPDLTTKIKHARQTEKSFLRRNYANERKAEWNKSAIKRRKEEGML